MVDKYFELCELDPCRESIKLLVDDLAHRLYDAGKIKDLHADEGLFQRLTSIEAEFPGANILLHKLGALPQVFPKKVHVHVIYFML